MPAPMDRLSPIVVRRLKGDGWAKLSLPDFRGEPEVLIAIARQLGNITPGRKGQKLETLTPVSSDAAHPNSLSARYGRSAFPFHTDGAHFPIPARYIVLACVKPGSLQTPTVLIRFDDLQLSEEGLDMLERGIFLIRNGRHSFYSSIYRASTGFVRFNRDCMKPVNDVARSGVVHVTEALDSASPLSINWSVGDVLFFDNWRVLHARGLNNAQTSSDRTLIRIAIQ